MRRIFSKLLYEIEEERNTMLVTVIADRGSAPRGAGAAMLVGEKGRITGTIGGGAVEYQSEKKAMELLRAPCMSLCSGPTIKRTSACSAAAMLRCSSSM